MPDLYEYIPDSGVFRQLGLQSDYLVSLETLTGGRFRTTGNQIRDYASRGNPVVGGINTVRNSLLVVDESGNIWLTNEVDRYQINKTAKGLTRWSGEIASIVLPNGQRIIPETTQFSVTAYGTLLYVKDAANPLDRAYRQVGYDPRTGQITEFVPGDFRLATPAEALTYGAVGWLADKGRDIVAKAMAQGLVDDAGNPLTRFTDAAIYLAANLKLTAGRTLKLV